MSNSLVGSRGAHKSELRETLSGNMLRSITAIFQCATKLKVASGELRYLL